MPLLGFTNITISDISKNAIVNESDTYHSNIVIQTNATLAIQADITIYGDIQIYAGGVIDISANNTLTHYGHLSGEGTIKGGGEYKLYGNVVD